MKKILVLMYSDIETQSSSSLSLPASSPIEMSIKSFFFEADYSFLNSCKFLSTLEVESLVAKNGKRAITIDISR